MWVRAAEATIGAFVDREQALAFGRGYRKAVDFGNQIRIEGVFSPCAWSSACQNHQAIQQQGDRRMPERSLTLGKAIGG